MQAEGKLTLSASALTQATKDANPNDQADCVYSTPPKNTPISKIHLWTPRRGAVSCLRPLAWPLAWRPVAPSWRWRQFSRPRRPQPRPAGLADPVFGLIEAHQAALAAYHAALDQPIQRPRIVIGSPDGGGPGHLRR
jgi:hypothetical protein